MPRAERRAGAAGSLNQRISPVGLPLDDRVSAGDPAGVKAAPDVLWRCGRSSPLCCPSVRAAGRLSSLMGPLAQDAYISRKGHRGRGGWTNILAPPPDHPEWLTLEEYMRSAPRRCGALATLCGAAKGKDSAASSHGSPRHDFPCSYDEIILAAMLGISVPTHFINEGSRYSRRPLFAPTPPRDVHVQGYRHAQ